MKISTNCSPLVIYFGFFFFQTKQSHSAKGGDGWVGLGSDWRTKYAKGEDEGDRARNRSVFLISRSTAFWGASRTRTHTLLEKKVDVCKVDSRSAITFHQAT